MTKIETTLGIDLGTQSVKVLFYDFVARTTLAVASADLRLDQDANGKAEQQADWWTTALCRALSDIPAQIKQSAVAVSVSGQQHGFVPLDGNGDTLAPVKLWCDTSTEKECRLIMQRLGGEDRCVALSGNKILPSFTASKVLWFKNNHPALYAQLDMILLPHDYLNFWLTGQKAMEMGDASGTGFLNVRERRWSHEVLNAIDADRDLTRCLPSIDAQGLRAANAFIGKVTLDAARSTGLNAGIPVAIGGGDNMMGAIGTGNLEPGRTTISLGTSGTVYAYSDKPIIDNSGSIAAFCSSTGGWLGLLCTMNCTVSSEIVRSLLNVELADFDASINQAPIGSEGIVTLPFFNGERTPNLPDAKGCLLGLDGRNATASNVLRSSVEGATFALRFGLDELSRLGVITDDVVLTGGGANSAVWRQIVANIMGVPVLVMRNNEGAALGAALQAYAAHLGQECTMQLLASHYEINEARSCEPQPNALLKYDKIYRRYLDSVSSVTRLYSSR